ncbi:MAG: hypothetical protein ACREM8_10745 [Vulcanimicrobiaceae bacterium]
MSKETFGYGGIAISCPPTWTRFYPFTTAIRVVSIDREHGYVNLNPGNLATDPSQIGKGFVAVDPLRFEVDAPPTAPVGINYAIGGAKRECPEFTLADWQVDAAISLRPPPFVRAQPLALGMSRDALAWSRGYPTDLGDLAALRSLSVWHYGYMTGGFYAVVFHDGRVASFSTPVGLP